MGKSRITDEEFIKAWDATNGSIAQIAKMFGMAESPLNRRRRRIEQRIGGVLESSDPRGMAYQNPIYHSLVSASKAKISITLRNGTILVGSDQHFRPGEITTAHRAFLEVARALKPDHLVNNGDSFDGSKISRYPAMGFGENAPSVKQELECVADRLDEWVKASPNSSRWWNLGNHDARFEARLAAHAPEFEGVHGFHLKDHFPAWTPCMAIFVNNNTVIKHRYHNGVHAVYNNVLKSGLHFIAGHLHSLKTTPFSDYRGTRYGVDCGTMAEPYTDQFLYTELNPVNWRSGFCLLTFVDYQLMPPELCEVMGDGKVWWRGQMLSV